MKAKIEKSSAFAEAFEAELSADAKAILDYARRWGAMFGRAEITDIAPGAAWNPMERYPRTVAKVDPIRELIRAGLVEVAEERMPVTRGRRGGHPYKLYRLTAGVRTLPELLDALTDAVLADDGVTGDEVRVEIIERFGRPFRQ